MRERLLLREINSSTRVPTRARFPYQFVLYPMGWSAYPLQVATTLHLETSLAFYVLPKPGSRQLYHLRRRRSPPFMILPLEHRVSLLHSLPPPPRHERRCWIEYTAPDVIDFFACGFHSHTIYEMKLVTCVDLDGHRLLSLMAVILCACSLVSS